MYAFHESRSALAAAARLLLATERSTDLRAGRTDVDVDDAAVAARRTAEPLRLADVGGEDRRRQTLRHIVVQVDRLVEVVVGQRRTGADRTSRCARCRSGRASPRSPAARSTRRVPRRPAPDLRRPAASRRRRGGRRRCRAPRRRRRLDHRADERAVGERVADRQRPVGAAEPIDDLVEAAAVDDEPPQRRAPLAGGSGGGERDAAHDELDVGRRGDDRRVVATEFEQGPPESAGDDRPDAAAHRGRPRSH